MLKKRRGSCLCMLVFMLTLAAGCGSSTSYSNMEEIAMESTAAGGYTEDIYPATEYEAEAAVTTENGEQSVEAVKTERKLIRNVSLEVETESFDALMNQVSEKTKGLGGYIENSSIYNGSSYYEERRNADLTLRIPAERLDDFLSSVAETCNVITQNESIEDVTLQYVDMKSHKEALETEQDRLIELLEQAESVEDIITIESRLSEVRYQLESMESQLRTLDNQVSYSTVYLYIQEVKRYTPVKERTVWEKISDGFVENLMNVGEGIVNFFISLIISIPYLVIWAIVLVLVVFAGIRCRRFLKKREQKKEEKDEHTA